MVRLSEVLSLLEINESNESKDKTNESTRIDIGKHEQAPKSAIKFIPDTNESAIIEMGPQRKNIRQANYIIPDTHESVVIEMGPNRKNTKIPINIIPDTHESTKIDIGHHSRESVGMSVSRIPDTYENQDYIDKGYDEDNDETRDYANDSTNVNSLTNVTTNHTKATSFVTTGINHSVGDTTMFNQTNGHMIEHNLEEQLPSDSFIKTQLNRINIRNDSILKNYETINVQRKSRILKFPFIFR